MRTTLDIPDNLYRELKARAAIRGLKLKDVLAEMISEFLKTPHAKETVYKRSPLPVARRAGQGPKIPARSNAALQQILDAEDAAKHA